MSENKPEVQSISEAKEKLSEFVPTPPDQQIPVSSAQALKERLDWGEPALTILDARDRDSYLKERITGAMLMSDLENVLSEISPRRDMYVYGDSEEETANAANKLRQAGFERVSQLRGGLAGWKAISGSTEGRAA